MKFPRFHLSSALAAVLVAGGVLYVNICLKRVSRSDEQQHSVLACGLGSTHAEWTDYTWRCDHGYPFVFHTREMRVIGDLSERHSGRNDIPDGSVVTPSEGERQLANASGWEPLDTLEHVNWNPPDRYSFSERLPANPRDNWSIPDAAFNTTIGLSAVLLFAVFVESVEVVFRWVLKRSSTVKNLQSSRASPPTR